MTHQSVNAAQRCAGEAAWWPISVQSPRLMVNNVHTMRCYTKVVEKIQCFILCSGGDGIYKCRSGVRTGPAGGATVPRQALVLLCGIRSQVLR